jgi:phenylalanyl-tRNA synthetase beta chain
MRTPLSWLQEFTPLAAQPADRGSIVELASELDAVGLVVERTEWVGEGLGDVVLARVLEISSIPGADRIRHVVVDRGGGETAEVVCGAWNFETGDIVVLAPVGAELPGGFRIERRKMRGAVSNGMLCSGRELRLSDDHEGILVLASPGEPTGVPQVPGFELGTPLAEHLGFSLDVVFDLAIEPNRPDCLSMVGAARELAARYGLPLQVPEPALTEENPAASSYATIEIEAPELCQRLLSRVVHGVVPVASPALIQRRLVLAGMRPINHVVDASNYVMFEIGQPNHPYDLAKLGGGGLKVRAAHPGETLVTLDGETRILGGRPARADDPSSALDALICNAIDLPVGIAGIMGGQSSEIEEGTETVLLEVGRFSAVSVGRTARELGLRTEASMRFERGIDPEAMEWAAARFCQLVVEAAAAAGAPAPQVASGIVEANPRPFERSTIRFRPGRANALLGLELESDQVKRLLEPIGYLWGRTEDAAVEVAVPSWRPDVSREADVIEDVARTYGYRRIPKTDRRSPFVGKLDKRQSLRRRLRRLLMAVGAHEAWTASIVDLATQRRAGVARSLVSISNPMVAEESVLRGGVLAGLLSALRHNSAHRNPSLRLFEIGDVFAEVSSQLHERELAGLLLAWSGDDAGEAIRAWRVIEDALGLEGVRIEQGPSGEVAAAGAGAGVGIAVGNGAAAGVAGVAGELEGLHPARSGLIVAGDTALGAVGEVDPDVLGAFELPHVRVGYLELDVERLVHARRRSQLAKPVSRYPSSDIDLAFGVAEAVPAAHVEAIILEAAGELCESLQLFDVYRGAGLEPGQRSLGFRLRLCALDRTLTDAEVAGVRQRCIDAVEQAVPATLR